MTKMTSSVKTISVAFASVFLITGCGSSETGASGANVAQAPNKPQQSTERVSHTVKPTTPFRIDYQIIGTPVVGSPVTVQLEVQSLVGSSTMQLNYVSRDVSALVLGESQPAIVMLEGLTSEGPSRQQVTIVPQREGRHYLNVRVSTITPFGQNGTTMAIPIQVGEGGRELIGQDRITTTSDGERVRRNAGN